MKRIGILCDLSPGSPRVLGETLAPFVEACGHEARLFYRVKAAKRLVDARTARVPVVPWSLYRGWTYLGDRRTFRALRRMDAVVLCGTAPNAFRRRSYDIDRLEAQIERPVYLYSVQYIGNAPTLLERLRAEGEPLQERFRHHLAVSEVTEIRGERQDNWTPIGLYLSAASGLRPEPKPDFRVVVDFEHPEFREHRAGQIRLLERLQIPYLALEGRYALEEMRAIYSRAALLLLQRPESFGMPIAECLAVGTYVVTPDSGWAMAWRKDASPAVHGPGTLGRGFIVYDGLTDLEERLRALRAAYDLERTPHVVFSEFAEDYPEFYRGRPEALEGFLKRGL